MGAKSRRRRRRGDWQCKESISEESISDPDQIWIRLIDAVAGADNDIEALIEGTVAGSPRAAGAGHRDSGAN